MKRLLIVAALATASVGVGIGPASACQPDGPCPCAEEPTRTINHTWDAFTGKGDLIVCTY